MEMETSAAVEKEITEIYAKGNINSQHYQLLKESL